MNKFYRLFRLFHTLRYIRLTQLYYQVWYRIKNRFQDINQYSKYQARKLVFFKTSVDRILFVPDSSNIEGYRFCFLGLIHSFEEKIDWNCSVHGKLWNYNLQYLNYLLDDRMPVERRKELLLDISQSLLSGVLDLEPYPVSLRVVNTLIFLQRSGIQDVTIYKALLRQIDYLDHNLEYHLLANHLLENIFCLFIAAQHLKDKALLKKYEQLLIRELNEQILGDGGHYECTPMYQSILLSKLLLCIDLSVESGQVSVTTVEQLKREASRMLGWIQTYSFPDGSWALFNDAAEGIAPTTDQLQAAADRLGITSMRKPLNESGFRKISTPGWELMVKTGGVQPQYQPGHVHADIGSFCLWYRGIQYIIDPGISTYTVSEQRSWERSTAAHNTVAIGNINQSDIWGGFRVGRRARVLLKDSTKHSITVLVRGYGSKNFFFQRSIIAGADFIEINDKVEAKNANWITQSKGSILFNPAIELIKETEYRLKANKLSISFKVSDFEICNAQAAHQYNQLVQTKKILYKIERIGGSVTIRFQ